MEYTKTKLAIAVGVGLIFMTEPNRVIVAQTTALAPDTSLTLSVKPDVFTRNLKARAVESMNTPSTHPLNILLDVLRMEGFVAGTNRPIELNKNFNQVTTRNTPEALEIFRKIIADLNREDGVRTYPPNDASAPKGQAVLIQAQLYKMSDVDFKGLNLGRPTFPGRKANERFGTSDESPFWNLSLQTLQKTRDSLKARGVKPFQSPRMKTAYGIPSSLFVGGTVGAKDENENTTFTCLPLPPAGQTPIELKMEVSTKGKFNSNPAGDWPVFSGRTNCAFFARAALDNETGLLLRAQNKEGMPANNLVILIHLNEVRQTD